MPWKANTFNTTDHCCSCLQYYKLVTDMSSLAHWTVSYLVKVAQHKSLINIKSSCIMKAFLQITSTFSLFKMGVSRSTQKAAITTSAASHQHQQPSQLYTNTWKTDGLFWCAVTKLCVYGVTVSGWVRCVLCVVLQVLRDRSDVRCGQVTPHPPVMNHD